MNNIWLCLPDKRRAVSRSALIFLSYFGFFLILYTVGVVANGYRDNACIIAGDFVQFLGTPVDLVHAIIYSCVKYGFILSLIKVPLYLIQLPGVLFSSFFHLPPVFVAIFLFSVQSALLAASFSGYVWFLFQISPVNIYVVICALILTLNPYAASVITNVNVMLSFFMFSFFVLLFDFRLYHSEKYWLKLAVDGVFCLSGLLMLINISSYIAVFVAFIVHVVFFYSMHGAPRRFLRTLSRVSSLFLVPLVVVGLAYSLGFIDTFQEIKNNVGIETLQGAVGLLQFVELMPRWVIFSADPALMPLYHGGYILPFSLLGISVFGIACSTYFCRIYDSDNRIYKNILYLFGLISVGVFLSKGVVPPFGIFYKVVNSIPFAGTLFREPATKFVQIFFVPLMALFSFFLVYITGKGVYASDKVGRLPAPSMPIRNGVVFFMLVAVLLAFVWPFINGLYFVKDNGKIPNMVTASPKEWEHMARLISEGGGKALSYPKTETYQHYLYGWDGMHSVDFLGFNFPFIENGKSDYLVPRKDPVPFWVDGLSADDNPSIILNGEKPTVEDVYDMLCHANLGDRWTSNEIRVMMRQLGINKIVLRNDLDLTNYGYSNKTCDSIATIEKNLAVGGVVTLGRLSNICSNIVTDALAAEQCRWNIVNNGDFVLKLIRVY